VYFVDEVTNAIDMLSEVPAAKLVAAARFSLP
jgi:hypothetical protein